jgi:S1-C subfamily serine protease
MEAGDVITRLNGKPVFAPSDVTSAIAAMHPGQQLKIQYQGSGVPYSSSVPLATRPAGYP